MNTSSSKNNNLLTGHMIVSNEDQWVWFAIKSVIDYVSKLFIYDTGSIDNTVKIIKSIKSTKIVFKDVGRVDNDTLTKLRQDQVDKTRTDWFLIIDGDEVWPKKSIESVINIIKTEGNDKIGIVSKTNMCIGDIYHIQDEKAGRYHIGNKKGQYNIRFYRRKKGFHWIYPYPDEAYVNSDNVAIQKRDEKLIFTDQTYWHMRHLLRSSKVKNPNMKLEIGNRITGDIPEVFFKNRPSIIPSPFTNYTKGEYIIASLLTPVRKLKRKLLSS